MENSRAVTMKNKKKLKKFDENESHSSGKRIFSTLSQPVRENSNQKLKLMLWTSCGESLNIHTATAAPS